MTDKVKILLTGVFMLGNIPKRRHIEQSDHKIMFLLTEASALFYANKNKMSITKVNTSPLIK